MTSKTRRAPLKGLKFNPDNRNAPIGANIENMGDLSPKPSAPVENTGITVLSNLPKLLPISNSELILVKNYLGEFVNSILANDNEPE